MKLPLSWLREWVDVELPVDKLATRLTMAGLEVEEVERIGSHWRGVTIARVVDLERHPRADSLSVAQLDAGGRTVTVVTAAPNLYVGAVVPYVPPGGRLASGELTARAFQGITSEGMLCSGDELDVSSDREGIYLLEESAPVGQPLDDFLNETVLDIYITANRPDCMSVLGLAREVHALTGGALRLPQLELPRGSEPASSLVSVRIEDPVGCPRFTLGVVRGVNIGPSPLWLQRRLHFSGVRAISTVVDVTNYVMLELGQPLHAFDRAKITGSTIVARRARAGERLVTLDGIERVLSPEMLVVADEDRARSLAGIMGGEDSEIGSDTRDILLEGANWDRATIRLTSSATGLSSEAGRRFGRGVDPELTALAVSRAANMTVQLAGGSTADGLVDEYPDPQRPRLISVTPRDVERLLGAHYDESQIADVLGSLGFGVERGPDALEVTVPTHRRYDVEHRADLAEEVARVVGYDTIPTTLPAGRVPEPRSDGDAGFADEQRARELLAAAGLQEVITYSLVDPIDSERLEGTEDGGAAPLVRVVNPLSSDHAALRSSLLGSLLGMVRDNLRNTDRVLLYELAKTWRVPVAPLPNERREVGIAMVGPRARRHWSQPPGEIDFFDLKGIVDALFHGFGLEATYADSPDRPAHLHPGRSAWVLLNGDRIGSLGQLHPSAAERLDLPELPIFVAEVVFEELLKAKPDLRRVASPPRFPPAQRDVSIIVEEGVRHADVVDTIRQVAGPLLRSVELFDVYRGQPIPAGRKSLAYALAYQASDRTLEDAEVSEAQAAVEEALRQRFGAEIRGR